MNQCENAVFYPPVSFYFSVKLSNAGEIVSSQSPDTSFMEVSGISSKMETDIYKEGGNHKCVYNLPTGIKCDNLQLKRGITNKNSDFAKWCLKNLKDDAELKIITGTLEVSLLDREACPLCSWQFKNAYPVKWSVDSFNSKKNELAIETIEICYNSLARVL